MSGPNTAVADAPAPARTAPRDDVAPGIEALVKRATTDAEFRALALRDPSAAYTAVAGKSLPEHFRLGVVDNARAQLTLVLPDLQEAAAASTIDKHAFSLSLEWTESEAEAAARALAERARIDPVFRSRALADPRAAVEELTGKPMPEGFTLRLVDNAHANMTVVLPDIVEPRVELSESELAAVAGGSKKGLKAFWSGFSADFVLLTGGDFIGQAKGCLK